MDAWDFGPPFSGIPRECSRTSNLSDLESWAKGLNRCMNAGGLVSPKELGDDGGDRGVPWNERSPI